MGLIMTDRTLFEMCEGLPFFARDQLYVIHAGAYPTGNGALMVTRNGEPECKITVNLRGRRTQEARCKYDEFFVKREEVAHIKAALLNIGVFEDAEEPVVRHADVPYADLWRFTWCSASDHIRSSVATMHKVLCLTCMDRYRKSIASKQELLAAQDTVARLRNTKRGTL